MNPHVYLAGPLFSQQDRDMLVNLEKSLAGVGIRCFLPHREVGDLAVLRAEVGEDQARRHIFQSDMRGVEDCAIICALLDGTDVDSGTAAEMGYAGARGKPIFGLCTDQVRRGRTINNVVWGLCAEGSRIHSSINDLVQAVCHALVQLEVSGIALPLQLPITGLVDEKFRIVSKRTEQDAGAAF